MIRYYLYVKTHRKTGLKYLGQTSRPDPHRYTGSGKVWLKHLRTHGFEFDTQILFETCNKDELKKMGVYYSDLYNVVNDRRWANLKPETGDGGTFEHTEEAIEKIRQSTLGRPNKHKGKTYKEIQKDPTSANARKAKHSKWMNNNNPFRGKNHSETTIKHLSRVRKKLWATPEYREKMKEAFVKRPKLYNESKLYKCTTRKKDGYHANKGRVLLDTHKQKISHSMKGKNLGRKQSNETCLKKSLSLKGQPKPLLTCPHCAKTGGAPQMKRYHFDNCKRKNTNESV